MAESMETWKNTMAGTRHVLVFDRTGRETTKVIQPFKTFTITTFERQINQDRAVPEYDMFKNGTFEILRPGPDTDDSEFEGKNALTSSQIADLANELIGNFEETWPLVEELDSLPALEKLHEQVVLVSAPNSVVEAVQGHLDELRVAAGGMPTPAERHIVTTAATSGGPKKPVKPAART